MEDTAVCQNNDIGQHYEQVCTANNLDYQSSNRLFAYRPHSALARAIYEKQISDERLVNFDKNQWYECDLSSMPQEIRVKFVQLSYDDDTDVFLSNSMEKSDWIFTQLWHSLAKSVLSWFMTQTSINGFLGRGSMFVVSRNQFRQLTDPVPATWEGGSLLDLGAGDGEVTLKLAPTFSEVYVTEMSPTMQGILQRRGYRLLDVNKWMVDRKYDVISCMNLLDRCDTPLILLEQIKDALAPQGIVIVALVLPFSQYVESGRTSHVPLETLPIKGATFEEQVASAALDLFEPAGYEVISWSRVPYLCEGDLKQCYYWLDDSIFVLKVRT